MERASVYEQNVVIPTYRTGPLEKNPLFIEKRAYQGSTGKVYPVPICESIGEEKEVPSATVMMPLGVLR
jgi:hypothetical protein